MTTPGEHERPEVAPDEPVPPHQAAEPGGDEYPDPEERTPDDPLEAVGEDAAATVEDYEPRDPDPEVIAGRRPEDADVGEEPDRES